MKTVKKKIKNSIRAYIMGDALGVPFEFQNPGTFKCEDFSSGGFHQQAKGSWSDDSSILLCLIDAWTKKGDRYSNFEVFKDNLNDWYQNKRFSAGSGLFDIGVQTSNAILHGGSGRTDRMGNGALFYCLPITAATLNESERESQQVFNAWSCYTHNNTQCFEFGWKFCCLLRKLFRNLPLENIEVESFYNRGDVINTYRLVVYHFLRLKDCSSTLFEDLCQVVNLGLDTDTNAALFGALMGTIKEVDENDWKKVKKYRDIDKMIDNFINSLIMD